MGAFESSRHMPLNTDDRLWVSPTGDDVWGNGSPYHPFASLQAGVDYAKNTDTLVLLPGLYANATVIDNKSLTISSEFILNGDSAYVDSVILMPDPEAGSSVITARNIDSLKLFGLTLANGTGYRYYNNYTYGGGLYSENAACSLGNVIFKNNLALFAGGAIFAQGSFLFLSDLVIENNAAYFGGGIALSSSTVHGERLMIDGNTASSGGGLHLENASKLVAFYSRISGNTANSDSLSATLGKPSSISQYGGGIYAVNSDVRLHTSLVDNNAALNKGGAMAFRGSTVRIVQSTLADNHTEADSTGALYIKDTANDALLLNSVLWNTSEYEIEIDNAGLDLVHSSVKNGIDGVIERGTQHTVETTALLDADPLFESDYSLGAGSACLEQGLSIYVIDNRYLINYASEDYSGAAPSPGYLGATPLVSYVLTSLTTLKDLPEDHSLLSAYPNPFNPVANLTISLPESGVTSLLLYDLNGRLVIRFFEKYLDPGRYAFYLDGADFPSGIYIARLIQNRSVLSSIKMTLVK
jgi:predicted outer membrane repeat protein